MPTDAYADPSLRNLLRLPRADGRIRQRAVHQDRSATLLWRLRAQCALSASWFDPQAERQALLQLVGDLPGNP